MPKIQRTRPEADAERPATIGVTRCSKLDDYVASVEQAGARARILEVTESPRKVLGEVDGMLLTGGGDVDPVLLRRGPPSAHVDDAEPGRDEFEIDLARRAMSDDLPLLAICRGAQVLNVAAGGTLVQDIPSAVDADLRVTRSPSRKTSRHDIAIVAGTRLATVLGPRLDAGCSCRVNSRHHQSVGRIGDGLVGQRPRHRRRGRGDRGAGRRVLRRRAVAPGEFLAYRRVRPAVRGVRRRRARAADARAPAEALDGARRPNGTAHLPVR